MNQVISSLEKIYRVPIQEVGQGVQWDEIGAVHHTHPQQGDVVHLIHVPLALDLLNQDEAVIVMSLDQ